MEHDGLDPTIKQAQILKVAASLGFLHAGVDYHLRLSSAGRKLGLLWPNTHHFERRASHSAVAAESLARIRHGTLASEAFIAGLLTIEACASPASIIAAITAAGFVDVHRHIELGIFSEYRATKPAELPPQG